MEETGTLVRGVCLSLRYDIIGDIEILLLQYYPVRQCLVSLSRDKREDSYCVILNSIWHCLLSNRNEGLG